MSQRRRRDNLSDAQVPAGLSDAPLRAIESLTVGTSAGKTLTLLRLANVRKLLEPEMTDPLRMTLL